MPRIYSNYSEEEYNILLAESRKYGMTLSAFQKYRSLLGLESKTNLILDNDISFLIEKMLKNAKERAIGDPFIVSALLPDEWVTLNRSQKMTLSKSLKKYVDENQENFTIVVLSDNTNQYKKIK